MSTHFFPLLNQAMLFAPPSEQEQGEFRSDVRTAGRALWLALAGNGGSFEKVGHAQLTQLPHARSREILLRALTALIKHREASSSEASGVSATLPEHGHVVPDELAKCLKQAEALAEGQDGAQLCWPVVAVHDIEDSDRARGLEAAARAMVSQVFGAPLEVHASDTVALNPDSWWAGAECGREVLKHIRQRGGLSVFHYRAVNALGIEENGTLFVDPRRNPIYRVAGQTLAKPEWEVCERTAYSGFAIDECVHQAIPKLDVGISCTNDPVFGPVSTRAFSAYQLGFLEPPRPLNEDTYVEWVLRLRFSEFDGLLAQISAPDPIAACHILFRKMGLGETDLVWSQIKLPTFAKVSNEPWPRASGVAHTGFSLEKYVERPLASWFPKQGRRFHPGLGYLRVRPASADLFSRFALPRDLTPVAYKELLGRLLYPDYDDLLAQVRAPSVFDAIEILFHRLQLDLTEHQLGKVFLADSDSAFRRLLTPKMVLGIEAGLNNMVVGQEEAIGRVAARLELAASGLTIQDGPLGAFASTGRTGTGKSALGTAIAEFLGVPVTAYNGGDLTEVMAMTKLSGAAPGYAGYDAGGALTSFVKKNPLCVVVMDEFQRASRHVHDGFFEVLQTGLMRDTLLGPVSFHNAIILFTTNAGVSEVHKLEGRVGFSNHVDGGTLRSTLEQGLRRKFEDAFLNRLDGLLLFRDLDETAQLNVVTRMIGKLRMHIARSGGHRLFLEPGVVQWIATQGFTTDEQARGLQRQVHALSFDLIRAQGTASGPLRFDVSLNEDGAGLVVRTSPIVS